MPSAHESRFHPQHQLASSPRAAGAHSISLSPPYSPAVCHCRLCLSPWLVSTPPVNLCRLHPWATLCIIFCLRLPVASSSPPTFSMPLPYSRVCVCVLPTRSIFSVSFNLRALCLHACPSPSISASLCLCLSPQTYFSLSLPLSLS